MARLLLQALDLAGYETTVVSDFRSFSREPAPEALAALEEKAATIRATLLRQFALTGPPDFWLTYHPFYKSPDLLGPSLTEALEIPYATVEASHAPKRNRDDWQAWQALAERSLRLGEAHFCLTQRDRLGLARFLNDETRLISLPPFLDTTLFEKSGSQRPAGKPLELVTVAMMRFGDKLQSYEFLAKTLAAGIQAADWRLTVIGDGPARVAVETAFSQVDPTRLEWRGAISASEVMAALRSADLYVWPGFGEAYGMAYLEAQAAGLPVLALDTGGISEVVRNSETGILVPTAIPEEFARALDNLMASRETIQEMGTAARRFVLGERGLDHAAAILKAGIEKVMQ